MSYNKSLLTQITKTIVKSIKPRQIILFGSYAKGLAGYNSDIDLIIVEDRAFNAKRSRRKEMTKIWLLLSKYQVPKDILVYSLDEITQWKNVRNHIIARALKEGKVLYDRT